MCQKKWQCRYETGNEAMLVLSLDSVKDILEVVPRCSLPKVASEWLGQRNEARFLE